MWRRTPIRLFLLGAVLGFGTQATAQPCPSSCIEPIYPPICSTAAKMDSCDINNMPGFQHHGCAAYDLVAGTWSVLTGQLTTSSVLVVDDFRLVGPAGPTEIDFSFVLHGTGEFSPPCPELPHSYSYAELTIEADGAPPTYWNSTTNCEEGGAVDRSWTLPLQHPVGETFRIRMQLTIRSAVHSFGSLAGAYTFEGLPDGYSIESCQGFASLPVSVHSLPWGGFKSLYR